MQPAALTPRPSRLSALLPLQWRGRPFVPLYLLVTAIAFSAVLNAVVLRHAAGDSVFLPFAFDRQPCVTRTELPTVNLEDCIVAIDGRKVAGGLELQSALHEIGSGRTVRVDLRRVGGGEESLELPVRARAPRWVLGSHGLLWFALGLLVFWFRPVGGEAFVLFLMCMAQGANHGAAAMDVMNLPGAGWSYFWSFGVARYLGSATLISLACLLPYPLPFAKRHPVVPAVLTLALVAGSLSAADQLLGWFALETSPPVWSVLLTGSLMFFVAALVARHRVPQPPRVLAQIRVLYLAVLFRLPASLITAGDYAFGTHFSAQVGDFTRLSVLGTAAMLVYAVLQLDVLALDKTAARIAAYGGAVFSVGFALGTAVVMALAFGAPPQLLDAPAVVALVGVLGATAFVLMLRVLKRAVNRYLRRANLTFAARMRAVNEVLEVIATQPLPHCTPFAERVLAEVLDTEDVRLLRPGEDAQGWLSASDGSAVSIAADRVRPIDYEGRVIAGIATGRHRSIDSEHLLERFRRGAAISLSFQRQDRSIGPYQILGHLGAGGMGAVFLGTRKGVLGSLEKLAIKQLLPDRSAERSHVERFLREGQIAKSMEHPNIIRVYDMGEAADGYYLAMEYVEGCDASTLLRGLSERGESLSLDAATYMMRKVCAALDYAHRGDPAHGRPPLVHRDVSPHNVLVAVDGQVKLVDFGVAALAQEEADAAGKPGYIAPEILLQEPPQAASDIFSAGVTLYELILGEHPFRGASLLATTQATLAGRVSPLASLRPDVTLELGEVVKRAMARQPRDRFASAGEMADALAAVWPVDERAVTEELSQLAAQFAVHSDPEATTASLLHTWTMAGTLRV